MNPFLDLTDEKLMDKYTKGDHMAFEALYIRHKSRVYSYISGRVRTQDVCDEIFQNIFLKMHKSRYNYDSKYVFLKWLYTICRSELIDFFKYKKTSFEEFDEAKFLIQENSPLPVEIDLAELNYLSSNEKKALQLRYYCDQDFADISKTLKTTPANSRKIISRGLGKIRKKLIGGQSG